VSAPKVFISYSWSSPEHQAWVIDLASRLVDCGVDILLDKWDLREGQEANAFMEQMVSNPDVSKVIIVSDRTYVEKANARKGGAGTEAQIVSKEIYEANAEGKFVVAVTERDENGDLCVPAYYTSRIFIDLSDQSIAADGFERLLRWIYDKPLHVKPAIGKMPEHLKDGKDTRLMATGASFRRAIDAVTQVKPFALGAVKDYLDLTIEELEKIRLEKDFDPAADVLDANLERFLPYRKEFLELCKLSSRFSDGAQFGEALHGFFEKSFEFLEPREDLGAYRTIDSDNYRFLICELFLHTCTLLIENRDWLTVGGLLDKPYYDVRNADRKGNGLVFFPQLLVGLTVCRSKTIHSGYGAYLYRVIF